MELLHVPSRTWMSIGDNHIIMLSNGLHVFVRRQGVKCRGFDERYNMFIKPRTHIHIRTNLPGDRTFVRTKEKQHLAARRCKADSESEVEVTSPRPVENLPSRVWIRKRPAPQSSDEHSIISISDDSTPPSHRLSKHAKKKARATSISDPHLLIKMEPVDNTLPTVDSRQPSFSPSFPTSPIMRSSSASSLSHNLQTNAPKWPQSAYTCDLVAGFKKMDDLKKRDRTSSKSIAKHFKSAFPGVDYRTGSTYRDARTKLKYVNQEDLETSMKAGHTRNGLWNRLASTIDLRR